MRRVQEGMYVCCMVGDLTIGIDLEWVQEINRHMEPTPVPLVADHVRGLINLRGSLVTVLDLGTILRGVQADVSGGSRTVIVELASETIGLVVDRVGDVVDIAGKKSEAPPQHLPQQLRRWLTGMVQLEDRLLLLLDLSAIARLGDAQVQPA